MRRRFPAAAALGLLLAGCAGRCGARGGLPPPRPPTVTGPDGKKYYLVDKGPYHAFYDRWGRLDRIEYDSNGDGRPDHIARHEGRHRPYRLDVDTDFDGRMDRWEMYADDGTLQKVGSAGTPGGGPDQWAVPGPQGEVAQREFDADGDGVPERVEAMKDGRVAEIRIDGDRDGRMDRWQSWAGGRLQSEELDTDGDGRPDRRLRYDARGKLTAVEPVAAR